MKDEKRIFIAEDHAIVRDGLRSLLSVNEGFEIVGEAEDGLGAIRLISALKPDIVLLDLTMPRMNGLEAIKEIKRQSPSTKVLVLTVHKSEGYVFASLREGADGYIPKEANYSELILAIKNVLMGRTYISPAISGKVVEGYLEGKKETETQSLLDTLTRREREILKLVAEGYKNKDIADLLCISVATISKHRDNIMKKLDLHSAAALTAYAIETGVVII